MVLELEVQEREIYFECRVSLLSCLLNSFRSILSFKTVICVFIGCKPTRFSMWLSERVFLQLTFRLSSTQATLQYKHTFILQHTNQVRLYKIY